MKKLFAGIAVIILFLGFAAPVINGIVMEKVIKKIYRDINTLHSDTGADISVEIVAYERNFFSSEIEWKVILNTMNAGYGIEEIVFLDHVDHGFRGVVATTSMEKNSWYTDFVQEKLDGRDPLHITTSYKLLGNIISTVSLDAFSLESDGEVFNVQSATIVTSCDKRLSNVYTKASWKGLSVPGELVVEGVTLDSRLKKITTYIWDGNVSFAVENSWVAVDDERLELVNFKSDYILSFNRDKNALSIVLASGADMLQLGEQKIDNAFVKFGVYHLDGTAYEEFMKLYTETVSSVLEDLAGAEDDAEKLKMIVEENMAAIGVQTMAAYEKFLKKGLEITISDLHAQLPSGKITGDLSVSLAKDMTFTQFLPLMGQPSLILDMVALKSSLRFPAELAGDQPMLFAPLYPGMQTGLFEIDGEYLHHTAETRDQKLFLNGQEVQLD